MSAARAPDEARAAPETNRLLRILFLARELRIGGAERQLCLLARGLAERGHKVAIGLFYRGGELERDLEGSAVELIGLGKGGRYELLSTLRRLERIARGRAARSASPASSPPTLCMAPCRSRTS